MVPALLKKEHSPQRSANTGISPTTLRSFKKSGRHRGAKVWQVKQNRLKQSHISEHHRRQMSEATKTAASRLHYHPDRGRRIEQQQ
jgi:hypothetical protein